MYLSQWMVDVHDQRNPVSKPVYSVWAAASVPEGVEVSLGILSGICEQTKIRNMTSRRYVAMHALDALPVHGIAFASARRNIVCGDE